jgi:glycine cleavage system transcriptional repressor
MPYNALVTVSCPDRIGLVSAVTGCLFDFGVNLGDTTFAVLGEGAEFATVCSVPDGLGIGDLRAALERLPALAGAAVEARPFELKPDHGPLARITHKVECEGRDQPGLLARLSEVFVQYEANIVTLNAERVRRAAGDAYLIRFAVCLSASREKSCLATLANTAEELHQTFRWETVRPAP